MMSRKNIIAMVIAAVIILLAVAGSRTKSQAAIGNIFNFGGEIEDVQYCCDGVAIMIGAPRPGWFKIGPATRIYRWYNVFTTGPKTVGTYRPGGSCWTLDSVCELTLPLQGTIIQVGTSSL